MEHFIDWTSIKLTGLSVFLAVISWNEFIGGMSLLAVLSTIGYNAIRIYKEVKKKK